MAIHWFESKLNATLIQIEDDFSKFRISDALQAVYKLIWDDFCSQYLELIKPPFDAETGTSHPIDNVTYEATINFFDRLMRLAHPFMPFITEEIWQDIRERKEGDSICIARFPESGSINEQILADFDTLFEMISNIRNIRNAKQISPKTELPLAIKTTTAERFEKLAILIRKMANVSAISYVSEPSNTESQLSHSEGLALSFLIKGDEFFVSIAGEIDVEQEIASTRKELEYIIGFRESTLKKLSNEKFVTNAKPDLVERERQKLADADAKIQALEHRLLDLGK